MLTTRGWLVTISIAITIILVGLKHFLIYPLSFLIFGSFISKLNPKNEDNKGRNEYQVFANAGVGGLLAVTYFFFSDFNISTAFVLSFAVALSDTFSSEIGKRYGGKTINITNSNLYPKVFQVVYLY